MKLAQGNSIRVEHSVWSDTNHLFLLTKLLLIFLVLWNSSCIFVVRVLAQIKVIHLNADFQSKQKRVSPFWRLSPYLSLRKSGISLMNIYLSMLYNQNVLRLNVYYPDHWQKNFRKFIPLFFWQHPLKIRQLLKKK